MAKTIDEQFVEFIVKTLVGHPDDVVIKRTIDEKGVLLELTVHPDDLGRVIGRRGMTAQSIRTLLRALGVKNDARYNLKIIDNSVSDKASGLVKDDTDKTASGDNEDNSQDDEVLPAQEEAPAEITEEPEESSEEDDMVAKKRKEIEELADLDI